MKRLVGLFSVFLVTLILLSSCRVFNPSVMLRSKHSYPYTNKFDTLPTEYIIQQGDLLTFQLFPNEGFKIIDVNMLEGNAGGGMMQMQNRNGINYRIEADSTINLPIIGRTKLAGLDLKEAELFLEDKYKNYYNDPFVLINATNRRVIVFPGQGGAAQVVNIQNEYTTVIEALALVGGISQGGRSRHIKIIRGDLNNPEIYKLDLSTTEGLEEAKVLYVKANDIIYVEPSYFIGNQIMTTTSQVLGFITSTILSYFLITDIAGRNN